MYRILLIRIILVPLIQQVGQILSQDISVKLQRLPLVNSFGKQIYQGSLPLILWMVVGGFTLMRIERARAQSLSSPLGNTTPPELQKILERRPEGPVISSNTPSQKVFTIPSLWWTNQQFGKKLVLEWQAFGVNQAGSQQLSVVVRPELWTRYTYFERYAFILKFGTDASHFKYHLFVQDPQNLLLGTYTCNFSGANAKVSPKLSHPDPDSMKHRSPSLPCRLWLNPNYPRTVF